MFKRILKVASVVGLTGTTLFALTSCGSDSPDSDSAASTAPSVSAGAKSAEPSAGTSKAADQGGDASGGVDSTKSIGGGSGSGSDSDDSGDQDNSVAPKCTADGMKLSLFRGDGSMPVVYLKATNTAGDTCALENYPVLGYEGAQSPIAVDESSKPQSVVMVDSGKSAYAAIQLSDATTDMHRETTFDVGIGSSTTSVTADGSGLAINNDTRVTYWATTMAEAMGG